jgi:hypothetical protein
MKLRIALLATTLAVTSFAARPAQALSFSVQATAQTLGYPGCFTDDSGWLPGTLSASALSDPAGYTFVNPQYSSSAYGDVGSGSHAEPGTLHAWATGHVNQVSGQSFSGGAPYGYAYAYFTDGLTVQSTTLAAGTRVILVFGNVVDFLHWDFSGLYDGYVDMQLQVGNAASSSHWSTNYSWGATTVYTPTLTVTTTVGSRLSVDAKLRAQAKAMFYNKPTTTDITADATATLVLRQVPTGVNLVSDSGVVYPVVPAN